MEDSSQISLFANFDSANMARYERVYKSNSITQQPTSSSSTLCASTSNMKSNGHLANSFNSENDLIEKTVPPVLPKFDIEFNVWTKMDCEGLPGENGNRTWFYYGIKGGHGKWVKFNLMNLNKQGRLFEMGMLPVFKTSPGHEKWSRIYTKPSWQNNENNFTMSFIHRLPEKKDTVTYFAFCFPHSYEDCQEMLEKYDKKFQNCKYLTADNYDPEDIYYHRELLCFSLDRRRIDLITISASNMEHLKREPRFDPDHLFPKTRLKGEANRRCYSFDKKKVFILTSRVHPGETPASFVFNGFLEFILRKDDPRAKLLRKQFVFKLIPLLNPDGVARGHYRTDQTGTNLNRVYLNPDYNVHPSIYAVKSLLVYHHIYNRISKDQDGLNFENVFTFDHDDVKDTLNNHLNEKLNPQNDETILETNRSNIKEYVDRTKSKAQNSESCSSSCDNNSSLSYLDFSAQPKTIDENEENTNSTEKIIISKKSNSKSNENLTNEQEINEKDLANEYSDNEEPIVHNDNLLLNIRQQDKVSADHLKDPKLAAINPMWSGIAFYVDLHAHAAKRGVFMYGNSIENELYQIENVLYAKLVALSSQHFDFEGSNFSTKNMYAKDKREGLSKEGSGRVAMFKTLGIIHSYTLEGNYASGRVMNTISPAINTINHKASSLRQEGAISPALHSDVPPKFLSEHYADVGKAMAIAALDIIEMNPHTRVPNTSFGSLESIRNWIKFYIKSKNGGGFVQPSISKMTTNMNLNPSINDPTKKSVNQKFYQQQRLNRLAQSNNKPNEQKYSTQNGHNKDNSQKTNNPVTKRNTFKSNTAKPKPSTPDQRKKSISVPVPSNIHQYQMDESSSHDITSSINMNDSSLNGNRNQIRNNIKLIKDLEITNTPMNNSTNNLIKKNINYQNQLKLKVASRKSYSLVKQLKGYENDITIDYQRQEIIDTSDQIMNPLPIDSEEMNKSKSKLTIRQLLPISKAGIIQNNKIHNSLSDLNLLTNNSSLNQNIMFFNKMNNNEPLSPYPLRASFSAQSSRLPTPDANNDAMTKSTDASIHHKKIILSSITRNSGRKYLRDFKQVESSLSSYLKSDNSRLKDEEIGDDFIECQNITSSNIPLSLNKNQQNLLKKYSQNNNLVNFAFSTNQNSFKKNK